MTTQKESIGITTDKNEWAAEQREWFARETQFWSPGSEFDALVDGYMMAPTALLDSEPVVAKTRGFSTLNELFSFFGEEKKKGRRVFLYQILFSDVVPEGETEAVLKGRVRYGTLET